MSYDIRTEEFESIGEFLRITESRPENQHWAGKHCSSKHGGSGFTGTESWEEACELLRNGWEEPLEAMRDAFNRAMRVKQVESRTRVMPRYNVVGATPSVPRALMGLPESMVEMRRTPLKSKTVLIAYDIAAIADVTTERMTKAGVTVLELVTTLERLGYRVKLTLCAGSIMGGSECGFTVIQVKDYRDPLDIKKLTFPMAHPSMFRRFIFRWRETSPVVPCYNSGYGSSFSHNRSPRQQVAAEYKKFNGYYFTLSEVEAAGHDVDKLMSDLDIAQEVQKVRG